MDNIVTFPGSSERKTTVANPAAGEQLAKAAPGETLYGPSRSRTAVRADIDRHIAARKAYVQAVAYEIAAEELELSPCQIEVVRQNTAIASREMSEAARNLLICMPTDPKGLVDLLMYLEKNFSGLPQEVTRNGEGQTLAFYLLRTVRLSLREITKCGKYGPSPYG